MRYLIATLLVIISASATEAQVLPNPTRAEFIASLDHAVISSYEIGWFLNGATSPVSVTSIGKPAPDASNLCSTPINVMPLPFNEYTAKIRAIAGTMFSEWSDSSNPFQRVPGKPGKPAVK